MDQTKHFMKKNTCKEFTSGTQITFKKIYFFTLNCIYVGVVDTCEHGCSWRPKENITFPGVGVIGICEPPEASTLNH